MRVYCATCKTNFTVLPDDARLSAEFRFICRACHRPDNQTQLNVAFDPRLDRAGLPEGTTIRPPRREQPIPDGFHLDQRAPKPMKPGPVWSRSDAFLDNLVSDLDEKDRVQALVVMHGRWRRGFTFEELATATGLPVTEVRALLSVLRTQGNAVWEKRAREDAKFKKRGELSIKARELSNRGHTVREIAQKMGVSIGFVSELRRAA